MQVLPPKLEQPPAIRISDQSNFLDPDFYLAEGEPGETEVSWGNWETVQGAHCAAEFSLELDRRWGGMGSIRTITLVSVIDALDSSENYYGAQWEFSYGLAPVYNSYGSFLGFSFIDRVGKDTVLVPWVYDLSQFKVSLPWPDFDVQLDQKGVPYLVGASYSGCLVERRGWELFSGGTSEKKSSKKGGWAYGLDGSRVWVEPKQDRTLIS